MHEHSPVQASMKEGAHHVDALKVPTLQCGIYGDKTNGH